MADMSPKRIHEIDALRGIALLGIFIINIIASHAILSRYSSGPLEHLWRSLNRR